MKFKFFLLPYCVPDNYAPESISLAEGLRSLGYNYSGNINYWQEDPEGNYLIKKDDAEDYDVAIYDYRYIYHSKKWTLSLLNHDKVNILLDRNDWISPEWKSTDLSQFDFVLACHMLECFEYPSNFEPWCIGLTNRIIETISRYPRRSDLYDPCRVVSNMRVPHNLRALLTANLGSSIKQRFNVTVGEDGRACRSPSIEFSSADALYNENSFGRHDPNYYELLNNSAFTYSFGGYFESKPAFFAPYNVWERIRRKPHHMMLKHRLKKKIDITSGVFIFQFDNFRFWEALCSASVPISLDFDFWGMMLPKKPEPGVHYIGISKLDCVSAVNSILELNENDAYRIGQAGRDWVLEQYRPVAVAQRLINRMHAVQ